MKPKNKAAQSMGRARWANVSKKDRATILRKAALARWAKKGGK